MSVKLDSVRVDLKVPIFGGITGVWKPSDKEKDAAWELYVELITRISVVPLQSGEGVLREALNSLYSLFGTAREILRKYGPDVAKARGDPGLSFGELAIVILNYVLRPILAKWHPELACHEAKRKGTTSVKEHEAKWDKNTEFRKELDVTRVTLIEYSTLLAKVAGVKPLYPGKKKPVKKRKKNGKQAA